MGCCQVHWSRSCLSWSGWIWSWDWIRLWISHHWIREEPEPEAATVLLRHPGICSLRSHGTVLPYDGFLALVRILDTFLEENFLILLYSGEVVRDYFILVKSPMSYLL